ncbi:hypothetical protein R1flu_028181 [Riccia fluitans]|uniref:Uncharacterized protein n=1 Tax=Riccia fluitans TaxID=41844 RepID=A0ABD1XKY4_9MARC
MVRLISCMGDTSPAATDLLTRIRDSSRQPGQGFAGRSGAECWEDREGLVTLGFCTPRTDLGSRALAERLSRGSGPIELSSLALRALPRALCHLECQFYGKFPALGLPREFAKAVQGGVQSGVCLFLALLANRGPLTLRSTGGY